MADLDVYGPGIAERDEDAFVDWMAGAEPALRRSLARFAAAVDVEAIVQEALLRVWQIAPKHVPDGRPDSLLRLAVRMARNLAIDEARRWNRHAPYDESFNPDEHAVSAGSPPDPWLQRVLRLCLDRLGGKPGAALWARLRASGEPDKQLADGLGMAVNTFRQNVSRARRAVRECLATHGVKPEEML